MTALTFFNTFVGIGTILIIALIASVWILEFLGETKNGYFKLLQKHHFHFAFLIVLCGILGSLTYSNIFMFAPCEFCWWIRIFLYPQLIILGVGIWKRDASIRMTSAILSAIGLCFSIYLILLQASVVGNDAACLTSGVSCAKIDVIIFGWLTIPIMSLILFAGTLTFAWLGNKKQN